MGAIDLDPASSPEANRTVQAERIYTIKENGLLQPWFGRVWLNPPYGRHSPKFITKFVSHYPHDVSMALLLLSNTHLSTRWFQPLAKLNPIKCFPAKRLAFSGRGRPAHGSVILGFGVDQADFRREFAAFGWVP